MILDVCDASCAKFWKFCKTCYEGSIQPVAIGTKILIVSTSQSSQEDSGCGSQSPSLRSWEELGMGSSRQILPSPNNNFMKKVRDWIKSNLFQSHQCSSVDVFQGNVGPQCFLIKSSSVDVLLCGSCRLLANRLIKHHFASFYMPREGKF